MAIQYDKDQQTLTMHTKNASYQIKIEPNGFLLHSYFGKRISGDMSYLIGRRDRGFSGNPYDAGADRTYSADVLPMEYPCDGTGDYRSPAIAVAYGGCDLRYQSHTICSGKYTLEKLPAVYATETEAETLTITLLDANLGMEVTLLYSVLEEFDAITRAVIVKNVGKQSFSLSKVYSASLDWLSSDYDMVHFAGRYGTERLVERIPITSGNFSIGSRRGTSSHQHNPFVIIADHAASEDFGDCYGLSLLYSGGFHCEAERDQLHQTRVSIGIQDEMLEYPLAPNECFTAPEVVLTYSPSGFTPLSQNLHRLIRNHICRGPWKTKRRPILINNWEATYFDFDGDKIYTVAKQARALGVEMMVLDDGWFGQRNDDNSSLGDWFVNEEKMGGTLQDTVAKIHALGMQFGIWIEPEMVSENSDLYRTHPDWAFTVPGRKPVRSRNQLVLDFSRKEVVDYIFEKLTAVLDAIDVQYIKMDMNRSICDVYSACGNYRSRDAILYHYTLGVYDFMERLLTRYPDLLLEGCSGGGGRFDAGMLYYCPQIWCSDNTDAIERLKIQYGTSFGYPISTIGSHISAVPNHQTGRTTNLHTRGIVAMSGSFGYELDLSLLGDEEKDTVRQQIKNYQADYPLLHQGDYYRLTDCSAQHGDTEKTAYCFVMPDRSRALLHIITTNIHCNAPDQYIKLKGLYPDASYRMEETGAVYSGSALMHGGIRVPLIPDEYQAFAMHFTRI